MEDQPALQHKEDTDFKIGVSSVSNADILCIWTTIPSISKLPIAAFFYLPTFAIFIWQAYIRKNNTYTDHLILGFHMTLLLFILLINSFLVDSIFNVFSWWVFFIIITIYLFQAIRKCYVQGIFKTLVKYLFLNFVFFNLATLTIAILFGRSIYQLDRNKWW
jgi:hypothetical protein